MLLRFVVIIAGIASHAGAADFRRDIRPILEKHCYECHSEKAKKEKAGYVFDNLKRFGNDIDPRGVVVEGGTAGGGGAAKSGLAARPAVVELPVEDWVSADGKTVKARFVRMSGDAVVIRTAEGRVFKVPMSRLGAASQERAKERAKAAVGAEEKP